MVWMLFDVAVAGYCFLFRFCHSNRTILYYIVRVWLWHVQLKTITKTVISNQKSSMSGKIFGVNRKFNETNFDIVQYYGSMANASNTGNIINLFSLCFMRKTKQWFRKFTWKIIVNDTVLKQVGNKYFYIERK